MSTPGKVLLFLNAIAAVAFICLAAADYGMRQRWAYAVYRHDLLIEGLPLDEQEVGLDGRSAVQRLGANTLTQVFQQAGGKSVKTQGEELKERHDKLRAEIDGQPDDKTKRQKLEAILIPLQRTGGERDALGHEKLDELNARFEKAFSDASKSDLEPGQRRQAIAHILVGTGETPADLQRALVVVGLEAYAREVDDQAAALRDMEHRMRLLIDGDRASFVINHKQVVQQLEVLAERLADARAALQHQQDLVAKHQVLVNARKTDLANLTSDLEKAKQETAEAVQKQSQLENELFQADLAAGKASDRNRQLEQQIRSQELGR